MKTKFLWQGVAATALVALVFVVARWRASTQLFSISSDAMAPTLRVNESILVNKRAFDTRAPKRGDIAVFRGPDAAVMGTAGAQIDFVQRVIGEPGRQIEIVNGRLKIDGKWVVEPASFWKSGGRYDMKIVDGRIYSRDLHNRLWTQNGATPTVSQQSVISNSASQTVPADKFLVLGDNRGSSSDSHIWGFVPRANFVGRISSLVSPAERRRSF